MPARGSATETRDPRYARMSKLKLPAPRTFLPLAALATCALLAAGCAKTGQATTTTTVASAAPSAPAPPPAPTPASTFDAELATGPGLVGDTSQTAALSAPANSNGTTPSQGVIPHPSR
jgi:hypothetical protein